MKEPKKLTRYPSMMAQRRSLWVQPPILLRSPNLPHRIRPSLHWLVHPPRCLCWMRHQVLYIHSLRRPRDWRTLLICSTKPTRNITEKFRRANPGPRKAGSSRESSEGSESKEPRVYVPSAARYLEPLDLAAPTLVRD